MPHRGRSLRLKLAAWFVLVYLLIQATLLGGVLFFRRERIRTFLENDLAQHAGSMVDNILAAEVEWDEEHLRALVPKGASFVLCAIRDPHGSVLASSGVADPAALPFSAWEVVPAGPIEGVHTAIGPEKARSLTGEARELRLITLPFRYANELFFFQAATRDGGLARFLGPFADMVLLGVPVGIVAALIAGWVIAGRAVSPIQQLSRAARDVSPTNLSERFEVETTDREVKRLEDELNQALERLEQGYKAQDQFLSNVSHELRTPVAALLMQAQVSKMGERSLEKGYAFVDKAEVLLKRLGKVVESFLVLARSDLTKGLPRDVVSVIDIVLGCLHSCKELAGQSRVRLIPNLRNTEDEELLEGDAELLQTMVENLVHNAISHSPPGGEVAIEVDGTQSSMLIAVRDQGPGIPEEYLERVFERFVQVPADSPRRGTGLGLAIADGIARLHGGRIEVENNEGAGCTFVVTLPRGAPEREPPSGPEPALG